MMQKKAVLVSIIILLTNLNKKVPFLIDELINTLVNINFEIIIVNESSPDDSDNILIELQNKNPEIITYIKLAKNVGEYNAVMAGLRHCKIMT